MTSWFQNLTRGLFSKPSPYRPLYKYVERSSVTRIVEIGLGDASRARQLITLAARRAQDGKVCYTGIDLFEDSQDALTLKQAHQALHPLNAQVRLVPGNAKMALTRCANELRGTDLIVVSASESATGLDNVWHLVHRMLGKESQVWVERTEGDFEIFTVQDVTHKMTESRQQRRKAA